MPELELPSGWLCVKLQDITSKPQYGYTTKASETGEVKFLRTTDITKPYLDWSRVPYCLEEPENVSKYQISQNDILISRAGSVGFSCLIDEPPEDTVFASYLIRFKPAEGIHPRYLKRFLESEGYWQQIRDRSAGNAVQNVNAKKLADLDIPLAPSSEQTRIANKLDELLAQVDTIKARVDAIPGILKRFRQSVLAAAVSGRLTEEWRKNGNIEFDWPEVEFSTLIEKLRSGSGDKPTAEEDGVAILRSSAVRNMEVDYNDIRYLDRALPPKAENYLESGDLLFTRLSGSAEYVGNCARVTSIGDLRIQYPDRLFCAKLVEVRYSPYLEIYFSSNRFRRHISGQLKSSAGHQRITLDAIRKASVVIPSLEEQSEIVRKVSMLFELAEQVEGRASDASQRTNNLTQSILAKAFRGELVPQNPDDEPASDLLGRIQGGRDG